MFTQKLTQKSIEAIQNAQNIALENRNGALQPEHIAYSLLDDDGGFINNLLKKSNINIDAIISELDKKISLLPKVGNVKSDDDKIYLSSQTEAMLHHAEKLAKNNNDEYISVEHIMSAIYDKCSDIANIFVKNGINKQSFTQALAKSKHNNRVTSDNPESTYDALSKYGSDLTQRAREQKLDPVIGRDTEIRNVIRILSRKTKNNPVLIGEPGVGKTAIAEGLAIRIVNGDVPDGLKDKTVFSLDMGSLIAGAKFRGEFEERLKAVLNEIKDSDGQILMFIDELHTIVGAGRTDSPMDAGNLLKPMLARGELHCIGATTLDEYRKYIEKDAALERRFQPVIVEEPTVEDTISILRGLKERYEIFHGVQIQDNALIAAATLSNRYITDRFLPDKAIDLVDEACAMLRTEIDSMPAEMDELKRKIMQFEIEEMALQRETDKLSNERLNYLRKELSDAREKFQAMKLNWENEKNRISSLQQLKVEIEKVNNDIEIAQRNFDYETAAKLRYGKLPELENKLQSLQSDNAPMQESNLIRNKVTEDEITKIVSRWTGIPLTKLKNGEREKLLNLEQSLHNRVVGQEYAVKKISEAILRTRAGIADPNRPSGSFMFLGPTGVGKTELAKALAENLFDDERNIVRIDMSEYMEKHSVSRLIGAPPGYVGYDEGGQLTEAVRRHPYAVILFDEIEKAHRDVFNVLLQVLDDGRITDSQGRTVDFKNTIIIMTSNLGSSYILDDIDDDGEINVEVMEQIDALLKATFRPEFLNRLDEIIYFKPLTVDNISEIIDMQIKQLNNRLKDRQIKLSVTQTAKSAILANSYNSQYGARPIKRYIQSKVETLIAKTLIAGEIQINDELTLDYSVDDKQFIITHR